MLTQPAHLRQPAAGAHPHWGRTGYLLGRLLGMNGKQPLIVAYVHAGVSVLALIGATVLAAVGKLDGQAVVALYGAAIGLAGGVGASIGSQAPSGPPEPGTGHSGGSTSGRRVG